MPNQLPLTAQKSAAGLGRCRKQVSHFFQVAVLIPKALAWRKTRWRPYSSTARVDPVPGAAPAMRRGGVDERQRRLLPAGAAEQALAVSQSLGLRKEPRWCWLQ
jgi:hypothetical protein